MLFCTPQFVYFAAIVLAVYWIVPWREVRVWWLLAASFYFYASWNEWLALVVAGSSTADYLLARGLDGAKSPRLRRLLLGISLFGNLGLLAYFKYCNFFIDSARQVLTAAGTPVSLPLLEVILPIGISFYTFEAISYTYDVYRRRLPAERNLAHFLLFITFFPHMVAGPIVRAKAFLPQIRRPKRWNWFRLRVALGFIVLGIVKKMGIGDRMATIADPVFADPGSFGSAAVAIAIVAYAIQIYCDFSGYSDLAMGTAHLFGYTLTFNFNMPYSAENIADFWRRWHISLSSWIRDYIFIPLGGSRGGEWATSRNLMIAMTLGGLWHGANWIFVIWGMLHGGLLVGHRLFRRFAGTRPLLARMLESYPGTVVRIAATFAVVSLGWVLFRSADLYTAGTVYRRLFALQVGASGPVPLKIFVVLGGVVIAAHLLGRSGLGWYLHRKLPAPLVGFGYAAALILGMTIAPTAGQAFIYFQF